MRYYWAFYKDSTQEHGFNPIPEPVMVDDDDMVFVPGVGVSEPFADFRERNYTYSIPKPPTPAELMA